MTEPQREPFLVQFATKPMTADEFTAQLPAFLELAMKEVRRNNLADAVFVKHWFREPNPEAEIIEYPPYCGTLAFSAIRPEEVPA